MKTGDAVNVGGRLITFGNFEWDEDSRVLREGGTVVHLGDRLSRLLAILLERPGTLVTQEELISRAWPNEGTDSANLRAHMSVLRRSLGDGRPGAGFIANEHGRGYSFVATAGPSSLRETDVPPDAGQNFPQQMVRPIGRDEIIQDVSTAINAERLVTLVGSGGIGKSTVGLAVGSRKASSYADGVHFIDMSLIGESRSVTANVALALAIANVSNASQLAQSLRTKSLLLIFDNCDHVIDGAAQLAESLLKACPSLHILATSREPLRALGERVFRLVGMDLPDVDDLTVAEALRYSAIQLFIERASASSPSFTVSDADVPELIRLCRQLDGLPLAIELAAARVDLLGLRALGSTSGPRFLLQAEGLRTTVARHKTLIALLDWSYNALSPDERSVLCDVSVFRGNFTLDAAVAVATDVGLATDSVGSLLANLASKSLLCVDVSNDIVLYRLFETTRTYAADKFSEVTRQAVNRRHAEYHVALMEDAPRDLLSMDSRRWASRYGSFVGDVLAALEWAFSPNGDNSVAARLAIVSAPFAHIFGLFNEYRSRFYQAMERIGGIGADVDVDMLSLSLSLNSELTQIGEVGGYPLAREAAKAWFELTGTESPEAIFSEWGEAFVRGDYPLASSVADRMASLAESLGSDTFRTVAKRLRAQTLHYQGWHAEAKQLAVSVLESPFEYLPFSKISNEVSMGIILARIAFLEGDNDIASQLSTQIVDRARVQGASALCHALTIAAIPIAVWRGLLDQAEPLLELALGVASSNRWGYWQQLASSLGEAVCFMRDQRRNIPIETLSRDDVRRNVKISDMLPTFDSRFLTARALRRVETGVSGWNAPEVLRVHAMGISRHSPAMAGSILETARALAEQQGAVAWQQRIARM